MQESGALTATEEIALPAAGRDDDSPAPSQPFAAPQPGATLTPAPEIPSASDEAGPTGDMLLALSLVLLMVLWQVPHYWLLAMPDRDELLRAGFKVLPGKMSGHQLLSISHFWILGMITATLLLPPFKLVQLPFLQSLVAGLAIAFAVWSTRVQRKTLFIEKTAQKLRIGLHLYLGLVLGTILLNGLLLRFVY